MLDQTDTIFEEVDHYASVHVCTTYTFLSDKHNRNVMIVTIISTIQTKPLLKANVLCGLPTTRNQMGISEDIFPPDLNSCSS